MKLPDFLTQDDGGYIHFTGHRIGLSEVVYFYRQGDTAEILHRRFPTIPVDTFQQFVAHDIENRNEVNEYCDANAKLIATLRLNPVEHGPSIEEMKQRRANQKIAIGV